MDWAYVDQMLMDRCKSLRPWDCDQLTLPEIAWILDFGEGPRPAGGHGRAMSDDEVLASLKRWQQMTPRQRFDDIRARYS